MDKVVSNVKSRKASRSAILPARVLHRKVIRFLNGCEVGHFKRPVRVYFNQGRGLSPDHVTVLRLPWDILLGLSEVLSDWHFVHAGIVWEAGLRPIIPNDYPENYGVLLISLWIEGRYGHCPVCDEVDELHLWEFGREPTVRCLNCGAITTFMCPVGNGKIKRHYKAATRP